MKNETIVGVDGSPAAHAALRWAAAEAAHRDGPLAVINAYEWWWPGARMAVGGEYAEAARAHAESVVSEAIEAARKIAPSLTIRGTSVHGQPGRVLVEASGDAALMVVGNRGRGGFASMVLGSVGHQVATHAACPVVVARGRIDPTGPIVVGVDGSAPADHALGCAFDLARTRGCGIVAIRTYEPGAMTWGPGVPAYAGELAERDLTERDAAEHELLTESVAPWLEKFPGVEVECVVHRGHPAEMLAGLSHTASLVVVGSRGHGGFAGLRLGSIGLSLLHHADCPVLVDRAQGTA